MRKTLFLIAALFTSLSWGQVLIVNDSVIAGPGAFRVVGSGGSSVWGAITGTLSNQTDLVAELAKYGLIGSTNNWTGQNNWSGVSNFTNDITGVNLLLTGTLGVSGVSTFTGLPTFETGLRIEDPLAGVNYWTFDLEADNSLSFGLNGAAAYTFPDGAPSASTDVITKADLDAGVPVLADGNYGDWSVNSGVARLNALSVGAAELDGSSVNTQKIANNTILQEDLFAFPSSPTVGSYITVGNGGGFAVQTGLPNNSVTSATISNGSITEADLQFSNNPVAGYVVGWDGTDGFQWVAQTGGGGGSFDVNANYNLTGTWTWDERVRTDVGSDSWGYLMGHNSRLSGIYNNATNDAQLILRDFQGNQDVLIQANATSTLTNGLTVGGATTLNGQTLINGQTTTDQENGPDNMAATVGYVNSKLGVKTPVSFTAADTLEASHMNRIIQMNTASDGSLTFPSDVGEPGDFVVLFQKGAAKVEPIAGNGTTFLNERRTANQYETLRAICDADGAWSFDPSSGEAFTFVPPFSYPNQSNPNAEEVGNDAWSITNNQSSTPSVWTSSGGTVSSVADATNPAGVTYVQRYQGTADTNGRVNHLFNQLSGSFVDATVYEVDIIYKYEAGTADGDFQITGGAMDINLDGTGVDAGNGWVIASGTFTYSSGQQIQVRCDDDGNTGGLAMDLRILASFKAQ